MQKRHHIQFPPIEANGLDQDEAYFYLVESDSTRKMRFHDYHEIYLRPGLYEQLFYERLKCQSPQKVAETLKKTVDENQNHFSELRILDLGAGNGIMGETVKEYGVARLVGVDIIPEACEATKRDRPWVYDAYYVVDFCNLTADEREDLLSWSPNCLTSVAALGYGDIPPQAFFEALRLLQQEAWIAFNIKETFLDNSDASGFSRMIRELIFSEYLDLHHLERYWHRFSIEGTPLYYFAVVAKKNSDIPADFLASLELEGIA